MQLESEEFDINLIIPSFSTNSYALYTKAYVVGSENTICQQERVFDIEINVPEDDEAECITDDDCDVNEECVSGACQLLEEECEEGNTTACDTGLLGICSDGIKVCNNGVYGECLQSKRARDSDICNNGLDDNCDGLIDENCGTTSADSDNDGIPDSWELQYFGNLFQEANDDYDNDGVSNID